MLIILDAAEFDDDFKLVPVLARAGGWKPADRTFDGTLENLLNELNEAVAA
jgi:hypothetical protein